MALSYFDGAYAVEGPLAGHAYVPCGSRAAETALSRLRKRDVRFT